MYRLVDEFVDLALELSGAELDLFACELALLGLGGAEEARVDGPLVRAPSPVPACHDFHVHACAAEPLLCTQRVREP